jgi:hypothetical protein
MRGYPTGESKEEQEVNKRMYDQETAVLNALEYLLQEKIAEGDKWAESILDALKGAFHLTHETMHDKIIKANKRLDELFPDGIGKHPDDNCEVCQATNGTHKASFTLQ